MPTMIERVPRHRPRSAFVSIFILLGIEILTVILLYGLYRLWRAFW